MLSKLTRRLRTRAALVLAVLYAVCIFAPHAAMALSALPVHCLIEPTPAHVHNAKAPAHTHAGDAGYHDHAAHVHGAPVAHDHANAAGGASHKHDDGKGHTSTNCCGVFCLSAIGCEPQAVAAPAPVAALNVDLLNEPLAGRGHGRINRPPIV